MAIISNITWKNNSIEAINDIYVNSRYFWLHEKHIETKIEHSNLPVVTNKCDPKYKKCRFELVDKPKNQPFRRFIRNDLAEKLLKTFKTDKIDAFRRSLGFNVIHTFNTKEQLALEAVKDAFQRKNMQTQSVS